MTSRGQRRARMVLLWGLGLFTVLQLTGGLLLDYCWPLLRFPSAGQVLAALQQTPAPRVVFLGSSRTRVGIEQGVVGPLLSRYCSLSDLCPALNAGVPAGDPITEEFLLRRLLDQGVRPDWVVLEVSPETLNQHNEWLAIHVQRQLRWEHLPGYLVQACRSGQGMRFLAARFCAPFLHRQQVLLQTSKLFWPEPTTQPTRTDAEAVRKRPGGWLPGTACCKSRPVRSCRSYASGLSTQRTTSCGAG